MKRILQSIKIIFILLIITFLNAEIKNDERVIFYPAYALQQKNGTIIINIHGCIYEPETDSLKRKFLLESIRKTIGIEKNSNEALLFKKRIGFFLVDNERGKKIKILLDNKIYELNKSRANGHFYSTIKLDNNNDKSIINQFILYSVHQKNNKRVFTGSSQLIKENGISIISDIDDTIKISNVLDKKEMIKNTFLREFKEVPGMANVYNKLFNLGASFHYVSGSPWQLFLPINKFLKNKGFPYGSCHLKDFRLKDSSSLKFILADQYTYKIKLIESIIRDFPFRKFVLIGDSGEKDPEVYSLIAENFNNVAAVYIRDAGDAMNNPDRYSKLFAKQKVIFKIFTKPEEIWDSMDKEKLIGK